MGAGNVRSFELATGAGAGAGAGAGWMGAVRAKSLQSAKARRKIRPTRKERQKD